MIMNTLFRSLENSNGIRRCLKEDNWKEIIIIPAYTYTPHYWAQVSPENGKVLIVIRLNRFTSIVKVFSECFSFTVKLYLSGKYFDKI